MDLEDCPAIDAQHPPDLRQYVPEAASGAPESEQAAAAKAAAAAALLKGCVRHMHCSKECRSNQTSIAAGDQSAGSGASAGVPPGLAPPAKPPKLGRGSRGKGGGGRTKQEEVAVVDKVLLDDVPTISNSILQQVRVCHSCFVKGFLSAANSCVGDRPNWPACRCCKLRARPWKIWMPASRSIFWQSCTCSSTPLRMFVTPMVTALAEGRW